MATVISVLLGEFIDALTIIIIVIIMGFIQVFKAEKAMEALKKLASPKCTVIRDGDEISIPAYELVPGDAVVVREGDKVPADARIVEAVDLEVDESPLTGESTPVEKEAGVLLPLETPVNDRRT